MPKYPLHGNVRVAVCDDIVDLERPTVDEALSGADVTCDLAHLSLSGSTEMIDRTPWRGDHVRFTPGRYTFDSPHMVGWRFEQPETEELWDLAVFRAHKFLLVRRGVPYETEWAEDQRVDVFDTYFGKRMPQDPQADVMETFVLPLGVVGHVDDVPLVEDVS